MERASRRASPGPAMVTVSHDPQAPCPIHGMLDLQELLRRFRPLVVPPGKAGPATVPVDRTADIMAELAGVFASIDEIEDEADRIEGEAGDRAREIAASSALEAARLTSVAQQRVPAERAAADAERRRLYEEATRVKLEAAEDEARRIERVARERGPNAIEGVLRCVLEGPPG
jgi:hypothetical protein